MPYLRYPGRHHYAERSKCEGQQQEFADYRQDQNRIVRHIRPPGRREISDSLKGRNCRAAEAFPDNNRGPADRGDQHLAQEPALS